MRSLWDLTYLYWHWADPRSFPLYTVVGVWDRLPVCQCIFTYTVLRYRRQSHRWRRCEADGGLRTVTRLEIDYFRIFTGMYHRFRDPSDPYESKRRRTCPRHGTVSFCRGGSRCPVGQ